MNVGRGDRPNTGRNRPWQEHGHPHRLRPLRRSFPRQSTIFLNIPPKLQFFLICPSISHQPFSGRRYLHLRARAPSGDNAEILRRAAIVLQERQRGERPESGARGGVQRGDDLPRRSKKKEREREGESDRARETRVHAKSLSDFREYGEKLSNRMSSRHDVASDVDSTPTWPSTTAHWAWCDKHGIYRADLTNWG